MDRKLIINNINIDEKLKLLNLNEIRLNCLHKYDIIFLLKSQKGVCIFEKQMLKKL